MTVLQVKKEQDAKGKTPMMKMNDILSFTKQEGSIIQIKSTLSQTGKKATKESIYVNSEVEKAVMMKAKRIESSLPRNYPTMIKVMLPSHVTGGFWLGLMKGFCDKHLPDDDTMMDLEDENGEVRQAKFLANKPGLSGGWKGFSISHQLVIGDVIVFQLVKPTRFKVHIARASGLEENAVVGLLQTDNIKEQVDSGDANSNSIGASDSSDTDSLVVPSKSTISKTRERVAVDRLYNDVEVENLVLLKAQEVKASLPKNFPTMIKVMLPSHVAGGFSLSLTKGFGAKHLPHEDTMLDLEDEDGKIHTAKYLVHRQGLSGGWRAFSIDHKLVPGDVLVFQLVEPTKFKVYIARASGSDEVDVALGLLQMDSDGEKMISDNLPKGYRESNSEGHQSDDGFGFDISDGIRMFESTAIDFEQVKSFDDFDIVVNGLVINCELSKHLRLKYYELCSSQKLFLHAHILSGLNCKLIVGVIAETINIADAIRASKFSGGALQQMEDFLTWEKTLMAFEKLGMNVEFILTRLRQLMGLCGNASRHKRLRTERIQIEEEVEILKAKLEESVERIKRIDGEMEVDEVDVEVKFGDLAEAPWSL